MTINDFNRTMSLLGDYDIHSIGATWQEKEPRNYQHTLRKGYHYGRHYYCWGIFWESFATETGPLSSLILLFAFTHVIAKIPALLEACDLWDFRVFSFCSSPPFVWG